MEWAAHGFASCSLVSSPASGFSKWPWRSRRARFPEFASPRRLQGGRRRGIRSRGPAGCATTGRRLRCAPTALRDLLGLAPVSTAKVGKNHLLGQETRAQKRRGRALQGRTLAKATYAKSVALAAGRLRQQVINKVFGLKVIQRRLAKRMAAFRLGGVARRTKADKDGGRLAGASAKKVARVRAYDVFESESISSAPSQLTFLQKRRKVDEEWKALLAEGKASAGNQVTEGIANVSFTDFVAPGGVSQGMRRHNTLTGKRQSLAETVHKSREDPAWSSGSGLSCLDCGLKPELVETEESFASLSREADEAFVPRTKPVRPSNKCELERVRMRRNAGLCDCDPLLAQCQAATFNIIGPLHLCRS